MVVGTKDKERWLISSLLALIETPGDLDAEAKKHLIEDAHFWLDAPKRAAERLRFEMLPPGVWRSSEGEHIKVADMTDERLAAVLRHISLRRQFYILESLPSSWANMSTGAEDGFHDAMSEWEDANDTARLLGVTRVRSVFREALRRGWLPSLKTEFKLKRPHTGTWETNLSQWSDYDE